MATTTPPHKRGLYTTAQRYAWQPAFLDAFRESGNISKAAMRAGTTRNLIYQALENDSAFAAAFEDTRESLNDGAEAEAYRRAVHGVDKGVYYQGERVDTERVYSDGLLTRWLEAKRPDEWDRARKMELGVNVSGEVINELKATYSPEQLLAMAEEMERRDALPPAPDVIEGEKGEGV